VSPSTTLPERTPHSTNSDTGSKPERRPDQVVRTGPNAYREFAMVARSAA
jgi:hypothetical protein